ncbi:MAG TPA: hypothetical protein VHJ58_04870, partial [Vicinamibacterales bacterium]|nr:hypothetical protein [Vicinamibacterales bacterium]
SIGSRSGHARGSLASLRIAVHRVHREGGHADRDVLGAAHASPGWMRGPSPRELGSGVLRHCMAAVPHDTIEDTDTTPAELDKHFGQTVRKVVEEMTDDKVLDKAVRRRHAGTTISTKSSK